MILNATSAVLLITADYNCSDTKTAKAEAQNKAKTFLFRTLNMPGQPVLLLKRLYSQNKYENTNFESLILALIFPNAYFKAIKLILKRVTGFKCQRTSEP